VLPDPDLVIAEPVGLDEEFNIPVVSVGNGSPG